MAVGGGGWGGGGWWVVMVMVVTPLLVESTAPPPAPCLLPQLVTDEDDAELLKGLSKGYKKREDGSTTTFFDRQARTLTRTLTGSTTTFDRQARAHMPPHAARVAHATGVPRGTLTQQQAGGIVKLLPHTITKWPESWWWPTTGPTTDDPTSACAHLLAGRPCD